MTKPVLRACLAQINTSVGDIRGNLAKAHEALVKARLYGADLVLLPEMTLTGYPPEDLLFNKNFIDANLKALSQFAPLTKGLAAVVGFVDRDKNGHLFNAAAFIVNGGIRHIYHKKELPNYGVFDEKRYFTPGDNTGFVRINGRAAALTICEDIWPKSAFVYSAAFKKAKPSFIINISASPYHRNKQAERRRLIQNLAKKSNAWVFYLNLVGGQDELVFDGGSLIAAPNGKIFSEAPLLSESVHFVDIPVAQKNKYARGIKRADSANQSPEEEIYKALVLGTQDYVRKNKFKKVLIGLSGGIDSALVARIAVDALGASNVVGVTMPSPYTSRETLRDAHLLAKKLGIVCHELPITPTFKAYLSALGGIFSKARPDSTEENLQARVRGNLLMALSNKFGFLVLTTGNKSEMATGYCTLYGDMAGGFALLKDVPKTLVFSLSRYRNRLEPVNSIPASILKRPPTAELRPNQKDRDTLPPYAVLDKILEAYVEKDKSPEEIRLPGVSKSLLQKTIRMINKSEYKRRQAPPGIKITPKAFGRDRRMPITNNFSQ